MSRAIQESVYPAASNDVASAVLFEEGQVRRLAESYASCFILILQLRSIDEFGTPEELRRRILDLLQRTAREAQRAGSPAEDVHAAQFAVVAFFDETILSSNWSEKEHWLAKPLQLELYDRYDAGEEFFARLQRLRDEAELRADVLEVYYLCMALGFKGRYLLHEQEKLRDLIEETYARLGRTPGMRAGALSPRGKPSDQVAAEVRSKLPVWMIVAAAIVVGLSVYIGMSIFLSGSAEEAARAIEALAAALP